MDPLDPRARTPINEPATITAAECYRYVMRLESRVGEGFKALDDRLAAVLLETVNREVYRVAHDELVRRVSIIENDGKQAGQNSWTTRTALLTSVVSALIGAGLGGAIGALAGH